VCRCLFGGPRGGRHPGGGVPSALAAAFGWPPRGSPSCFGDAVPFWWPPRGSPSGRWRRARVPVRRRRVLRGAPGCVAGRRWGSEELRWCSGRRCLQTPWVRLAAPPKGIGLSGRGRALRCSPEEGRWGVLGARGWLYRFSEEGRWRRLPPWVRLPEGGWAHFGPRWRCELGGQAPPERFAAGRRPSEEGRARASRGDFHSPGKNLLAASPRRGGQVPRWRGRGRSSVCAVAGPRRLSRCRSAGSASAGAPPWAVRSPEGGWAARAAVCRFSVRPEGLSESLLCRGAAGPTRPGPPRWAGSGSAEAVPGCVLGCPRTRRRGRRCAEARRLRSPVVGRSPVGELPVAGRGPGSGGGRVLSGALRQAAQRSRGAFLLGTRQGDGPVGGKLESHTLKGCGHVKEQPEDCCCR
jgi:hypothetical protein